MKTQDQVTANSTQKRIVLFAISGAVIVIIVAAVFFFAAPARQPAPTVEFTLLDGNKLSLAELRNRPVLVSFWATSCPPCVEEVSDLIALYRELHPRGLEFIAVAMPYDPPSHVLAFSRRYRIPYPIALDVEGKVVRAFDVGPIPAAFLISPEGNVVYRQLGKLDIGKVRRIILRLLDNGKMS